MAEQRMKNNESIDKVLRKFKRQVKEEGILDTLRSKEQYEKPSQERKRRFKEAQRRNRVKQRDEW